MDGRDTQPTQYGLYITKLKQSARFKSCFPVIQASRHLLRIQTAIYTYSKSSFELGHSLYKGVLNCNCKNLSRINTYFPPEGGVSSSNKRLLHFR